MMNRRVFLVLSAAGLLTGCGFRLRGTDTPKGQLPESLRIETTDPYSPIVQNITRQLKEQGANVVSSGSVPVLKLSLPTLTNRALGSVSGGDQTELGLEMTYSLVGDDLVFLIPETKVRATLIYVDGSADTSAEDQRVAQLKRSLETDLLRQIMPSIRVRYEQALKQTKAPKAN
jgi:outer membrane lipopolysaccharide assembly protein LptE/RlpB